MEKLNVICPCCETVLTIDQSTGAILAHQEKTKPHGSFEDLQNDLETQKNLREQLFAQEMAQQKDRARLLDEKFEAAKKLAGDGDGKPFKNPLDFD